jgi:ATP-binding cassette subfamily B protein
VWRYTQHCMPDDCTPAGAPPAATPALPGTPLRFVWHFVAHFRYWYLAMLGFEAGHSICSIMMPYALSRVIKAVTQAHEQSLHLLDTLQRPLGLFVLLGLGEVVFARAAGSCQITIGPRQRTYVTRQLYAYLQRHSHRYLSDNFAGALAHRITETSMGVTQTLWAILFDFWPIAIVFAASITLLYGAHPQLAWFVALWASAFISICYLLATRCQPYALRAAAARSESTGKIVDSVTNLTSAKLFARLDYERSYLGRYLDRELAAVGTSSWYAERVRWFQFGSAAVLKVGLLYYSLRLWAEGQIGVAEFVMATSLSLLIITEARNLSRRFLEFFEFVGNVANGVHTIVRPHELPDSASPITRPIEQGLIEFEDVSFEYRKGERIFEGLRLTIPPGQRVGLVGYSGSGKSTFVNLILRLYDIQRGKLSIDGIDVRDMTQDALHRQLSLIPQDPSLFHRSLMENIRYGRLEASDDEVKDAAIKAHAHEFIASMTEGYASMVGERGVKLSGGQRQRIAIARVILKDAPVVILDEATSSLDSLTERAIQETLDKLMRGKTVLVVAHRLSTIAHLDRILVFDRGRIVEDGTHSELLARRGAYHLLWSKQTDGFLPQLPSGEVAGAADEPSDSEPAQPLAAVPETQPSEDASFV